MSRLFAGLTKPVEKFLEEQLRVDQEDPEEKHRRAVDICLHA